jgi:hypothetical protein
MSYETERQNITDHFKTNWGRSEKVGYPRHKFVVPEDEFSIQLHIDNGRGETVSVGAPGNNIGRYAGTLLVQIHGPSDAGEKGFTQLIDAVSAVFLNKHFSNLEFFTPYPVGESTRQKLTTRTIACPFIRDETNH